MLKLLTLKSYVPKQVGEGQKNYDFSLNVPRVLNKERVMNL